MATAVASVPVAGFCGAVELSEGDYLVDLPVITTATRLSQAVADSPASVTVIDRDMIMASGFVEISDLLRLVPGFQVGLSWRDHHTAFAYHGQSDGLSRNMQILLDGRIAYGAHFGLVDWDRLGITIADLERIEVVRGPSGAAYGSNAFSGTINLVTRSASVTPSLQMGVTGGSNDFSLFTGRYNYHSETLDYRLAASYFETEGFDNINDQVEATTLNYTGHYQPVKDQSLDISLNYGGGQSGRGGGFIPLLDPVGDKDVDEWSVLLRWNRTVSRHNQWHLQASYVYSREQDVHDIGLLSEVFGVDPEDVPLITGGVTDRLLQAGVYNFDSHRATLDFQHTCQFAEDLRMVWGLGVQEDMADGDMTFAPGDWEDVKGKVFGNLEKNYRAISFNAGFLFEDGDLADGDLSTRFGVNYRIVPDHSLRVSYAIGYRQPFAGEANHLIGVYSGSELVDAFFVTPKVPKPEKVESVELGYIAAPLDGRLSVEAKLYREKYTNQIYQRIDPNYPELVSVFSPGASVRENGAATTIRGFEFGLRFVLGVDTNLWLSYAYADADQFDPPNATRSLLKYTATPQHTGSLLVSHRFGDTWEASMGYYYLDQMSWIEGTTEFSANFVESYNRLDMRLAKRFDVSGGGLLVELIGQNLGDDYGEYRVQNQFTTRGFVRVTLEFD